MSESVYIETSIFSFYHDRRTAPAIIAMRDWTRQWWRSHRRRYEIATSLAALAELETGSLPHRDEALAMARSLPVVTIDDAIREIVAVYIRHRVMPRDPAGDALHLALASYHGFDFLLTWNCQHLANANKFGHIRRVNVLLGLYVPTLITPIELIGGKIS